MRIRAFLAAAACACACLVAACGGGAKQTASKNTARYEPRSSPYALSKCMRANGLSRFPDPAQGSGGLGFPGGLMETNSGELVVDGVSFSGPALKRASAACKTYLPPGGPPPALSAKQKKQQLQFAECMRANGVPNFPDPGTPVVGAGGAKQVTLPGSNSPAFNHASKVCLGGGGHSGFRSVGSNVVGP